MRLVELEDVSDPFRGICFTLRSSGRYLQSPHHVPPSLSFSLALSQELRHSVSHRQTDRQTGFTLVSRRCHFGSRAQGELCLRGGGKGGGGSISQPPAINLGVIFQQRALPAGSDRPALQPRYFEHDYAVVKNIRKMSTTEAQYVDQETTVL